MACKKENLFILTPLNFKEGKKNTQMKSSNGTEHCEKYDPLIFCRTCANVDPCLVPIFKEEGLDYSLIKKIEKYLPIQVTEEDDLPVHLCYHCASTLIAWDSLLVGCIEAEKKLTQLKNSIGDKQCEEIVEDVVSLLNDNVDSDDEPLISKKAVEKIKKNEEKRDILQEKNDLQALEPIEVKSERLMEEPDLSFSTYQHQFTMRKPFIFQIFKLRIENSFCCNTCSAVNNFKLAFMKSLLVLKKSKTVKEDSEDSDKFVRKKVLKSSKLNDQTICGNCGKVLSSKSSLKNHMKIHYSDETLTCHLCGKTFRHRFNLLRHLRVIHEGVRNHVCADCGKRYRSHGEMEDHRNIHNVQQKIICEECGRVFLTKASFYPHKKSHRMKKIKKEPAAFDCGECHKKFTTRKSRDQHLLIHTGEKPLCCTICGKKFRTKANFTQHAKVHSNLKPHACEHCGKAFGRKDHLRIHVRCHTGEKPFICNYCGRGFAQMNDMKKHSKIHERRVWRPRRQLSRQKNHKILTHESGDNKNHDKNIKESRNKCGKTVLRSLQKRNSNTEIHLHYKKEDVDVSHQCPVCQKTHRDPILFSEDLYSHLIHKLADGSDVWDRNVCKVCKAICGNLEQLPNHILLHVDSKKLKENSERGIVRKKKKNGVQREVCKLTCEICGKTISKKYALKRHLATHSGEKKFTCHHCGKQYAQESGLQRHVLVIHEGVRKYKCPICSKVFGSNSELKSHQDTHTDPRPFQCDQCGKTFISQKHLYHHRKYHHTANGMRQLCNICNRYFSSPSVLKRHHKVVHLGLKEFQCHVCSAQLSTKHYLQEHLRLHSDERPEVCSFCGKTFQVTGNLRQHLKTHMGKTQICYVCGKGFTRRCHLLIHIGSHRGLEHPQCELCSQVFLLKSDLDKHLKKQHNGKISDSGAALSEGNHS